MDSNNEKNEKVKIYINVEPLGVKFGTVFKKSETFQSIANFVSNQIKKLGIKFELGRINEDKTGAIILTDNIIGDFLQSDDQVTVYSEEYGFIKANLPGDVDHNSSKKIFYQRSISDLYKSKNFLKKKRNEKSRKLNNDTKVEDKKENESEEDNEEKEKKNVGNKEKDKKINNKVNNKNKKDNKKEAEKNIQNKNPKNVKSEKKEKKIQDKDKNKKVLKSSEKKDKRKNESSSESEEEKEEKNEE